MPASGHRPPAQPFPGHNNIDLPFATPGGFVETRVFYRGRHAASGPINVQPIAAAQPVTHYRDWPLAFLWVGGTFLVGWLFVQVMMLTRQRVTSNEHRPGVIRPPRNKPVTQASYS